jgi:hypothetical protein
VPRDERHPALFLDTFGTRSTELLHDGLAAIGKPRYRFYLGDAKELAIRGLIRLQIVSQSTYEAEVTNDGFRYYENMKVAGSQPVERIETATRSYLLSDNFERRHPNSLAKWKQAETALWSSDSVRQMTTIGHVCREAMQDFATETLGSAADPSVDQNIQHTVARLKAAIKARLTSESVREFAEALLTYWGVVTDLVQRQEHRASNEGEELSWEDARRVVFHTLVVMHEIDRSLGTK